MARKSDIRLRRSNVANAVPGGADLNEGELAINTMDGALYFKKSNGTIITGHDDTILHIDSANSRVGIGTTSPANLLSIESTGQFAGMNIKSASSNGISYIDFGDADDNNIGGINYDNSTNTLQFRNGNVQHVFLKSDGKVGIGTGSPSQALEIAGSVRIDNGSSFTAYEVYRDNILYGRVGGGSNQFTIQASNNKDINIFDDSGSGLTVENGGNVGIGTSSPAGPLHVDGHTGSLATILEGNGNGDTVPLHFRVKANNNDVTNHGIFGNAGSTGAGNYIQIGASNTSGISVMSTGKVGIGTSSPLSKLEVHGSVGTIPDTTNSSLQLRDTSAVGANNGGSIVFSGIYTGTSGFLGSGPYIKAYKLNSTSGDYSYGLKFATRQNGVGTQAIGLTITPDQKVGIGTDTPTGTFHVVGTGARIDTADGSGLTINRPGNSAHLHLFPAYSSVPTIMGDGAGGLHLGYSSSTAGIRIDTSNNVGIGTTSPQTKLDIAGASATDSPILRFTGTGEASQGDTVGEIQFYNSDTTDFTPGVMSSIRAIAGASGGEGQLQIYTNMPSEGTAAATLAAHFASNGNTIFGGTSVGAAGALSVKVDGSYTDLYLYGAGTSQGGRIFFGDSSDRSSIVGTYGTGGGGKLSFKTDTTGGTSQDRLVIDSDGSIRFNNAFTFPTSIGSAGQVLKVPTTGTSLIWGTASGGGGGSSIEDNDGDTKIQVEESADEDIIRFDIAGTQKMFLSSTQLGVTGDLAVSGNLNITGDINSTSVTNLDVTDKTITMANNSGSSTAADGAGIIIEGPTNNASLLWDHTNQYLEFNKSVFSPSGFIIGTTATNVGRMYNSAGVMALEAYTTRQISFGNATNGEHVRINADGNVGLGDTAPQDYLEINGSGRGLGGLTISNSSASHAALSFARSSTATARIYANEPAALHTSGLRFQTSDASGGVPNLVTAMFIDENQNVGIGTTTPNSRFTVNTTTTGDGIELQSSEVSIAKLSRAVVSSTVVASLDGVSGRPIHIGGVVNEKVILGNAGGNVGIGTSSPGSKLTVEGDIRQTTGDLLYQGGGNWDIKHLADDQNIVFYTSQSGSATEKMRIKANGNVGIRNTNPAATLEVGTLTSGVTGNVIINSEGGNPPALQVKSRTNRARINIQDNDTSGYIIAEGSVISIGFADQVSDNNININSSHDVGIGTTSPSSKLHINSGTSDWPIKAESTDAKAGIILSDNNTTNYIMSQTYTLSLGNQASLHASNLNIKSTGKVGIGTTDPKARLQVEEYGIDTTETSTTAVTQVAIHTFPIADFRSARFTIQITNTTDSTYHSTEILAIHDGTTANITEFGEVHTGSSVEATFDADINTGNFRLLATPSSTDSMEFKVVCHSLTV